jgi:2-keto-4-pentenoate hydratase
MEAVRHPHFAAADRIAQRLVAGRSNAIALVDYPGPIPPDLASGYECQEAAIDLWPDDIAGWKVGRIPSAYESQLGEQRLAGPIFRRDVLTAVPGSTVEYGIFVGGFAAIEAEYVFEIGRDAPPSKLTWSLEEAAALAARLLVGVEMAGSPLRKINALGPTVVVSDFGNNAGLIVGPEVTDWRDCSWDRLTCETFLQGKLVGAGSAENILGAPVASLRFVAELCAQRGRPLKAGMLISTGAATGIHDIVVGQQARVVFNGVGEIRCAAKAREARPF